jgi:hypothetical protein
MNSIIVFLLFASVVALAALVVGIIQMLCQSLLGWRGTRWSLDSRLGQLLLALPYSTFQLNLDKLPVHLSTIE